MANYVRCEESIEVDGQVYRLQLSINGQCEVEAALGRNGKVLPWHEFLTEYLGGGAMTYLRLLVWAALYEHHPDKPLEFAGRLVAAIGPAAMSEKMLTLVRGTQPDDADLAALGVPTARPPKARPGGTGGALNSKPGKSGSALASSAG